MNIIPSEFIELELGKMEDEDWNNLLKNA